MIGKHETTYNGGWNSTMKNPTFRWEQMALISRLIAKPMINISISVWFRSIVKIWSGQKCEVAAEIGLKGYIWRIGWQRQFCEDQVGISEWDAHHFVLDLLNHMLICIFYYWIRFTGSYLLKNISEFDFINRVDILSVIIVHTAAFISAQTPPLMYHSVLHCSFIFGFMKSPLLWIFLFPSVQWPVAKIASIG